MGVVIFVSKITGFGKANICCYHVLDNVCYKI